MAKFQVKRDVQHNGKLFKEGTVAELQASDVEQAVECGALVLIEKPLASDEKTGGGKSK